MVASLTAAQAPADYASRQVLRGGKHKGKKHHTKKRKTKGKRGKKKQSRKKPRTLINRLLNMFK